MSIIQSLQNDDLFIEFMTSEIINLVKFVECIWNKRKSFLENWAFYVTQLFNFN